MAGQQGDHDGSRTITGTLLSVASVTPIAMALACNLALSLDLNEERELKICTWAVLLLSAAATMIIHWPLLRTAGLGKMALLAAACNSADFYRLVVFLSRPSQSEPIMPFLLPPLENYARQFVLFVAVVTTLQTPSAPPKLDLIMAEKGHLSGTTLFRDFPPCSESSWNGHFPDNWSDAQSLEVSYMPGHQSLTSTRSDASGTSISLSLNGDYPDPGTTLESRLFNA